MTKTGRSPRLPAALTLTAACSLLFSLSVPEAYAVDASTCVDTDSDVASLDAVAAAAPGQALIAYDRLDSRPPYFTTRVKVRTISYGDGPGSKCTSGTTCSSCVSQPLSAS